MRYDVRHETRFRYGSAVSMSHQLLRLRPRRSTRQNVLGSELEVSPGPTARRSWLDCFGNEVESFTVQEPHRELVITSRSSVEVLPGMNIMLDFSPAWEIVARSMQAPTTALALDAAQYCFASPYVEIDAAVAAFARRSFAPGRPLLEAAMDLTSRIHGELTYQGGVTDVSTPVRRVLELKAGVCQDFAHLEIACLRAIGLPARYVSGYLLTRPLADSHAPERARAGEARPRRPDPAPSREPTPAPAPRRGADESHAWLSLWCPELGWVDFDPTNNVIPNREHITVAWGRDYGDVSPVSGFIFGGGRHDVSVAVDVTPAIP